MSNNLRLPSRKPPQFSYRVDSIAPSPAIHPNQPTPAAPAPLTRPIVTGNAPAPVPQTLRPVPSASSGSAPTGNPYLVKFERNSTTNASRSLGTNPPIAPLRTLSPKLGDSVDSELGRQQQLNLNKELQEIKTELQTSKSTNNKLQDTIKTLQAELQHAKSQIAETAPAQAYKALALFHEKESRDLKQRINSPSLVPSPSQSPLLSSSTTTSSTSSASTLKRKADTVDDAHSIFSERPTKRARTNLEKQPVVDHFEKFKRLGQINISEYKFSYVRETIFCKTSPFLTIFRSNSGESGQINELRQELLHAFIALFSKASTPPPNPPSIFSFIEILPLIHRLTILLCESKFYTSLKDLLSLTHLLVTNCPQTRLAYTVPPLPESAFTPTSSASLISTSLSAQNPDGDGRILIPLPPKSYPYHQHKSYRYFNLLNSISQKASSSASHPPASYFDQIIVAIPQLTADWACFQESLNLVSTVLSLWPHDHLPSPSLYSSFTESSKILTLLENNLLVDILKKTKFSGNVESTDFNPYTIRKHSLSILRILSRSVNLLKYFNGSSRHFIDFFSHILGEDDNDPIDNTQPKFDSITSLVDSKPELLPLQNEFDSSALKNDRTEALHLKTLCVHFLSELFNASLQTIQDDDCLVIDLNDGAPTGAQAHSNHPRQVGTVLSRYDIDGINLLLSRLVVLLYNNFESVSNASSLLGQLDSYLHHSHHNQHANPSLSLSPSPVPQTSALNSSSPHPLTTSSSAPISSTHPHLSTLSWTYKRLSMRGILIERTFQLLAQILRRFRSGQPLMTSVSHMLMSVISFIREGRFSSLLKLDTFKLKFLCEEVKDALPHVSKSGPFSSQLSSRS